MATRQVFRFGGYVFDISAGDLTREGVSVKTNKQVIDLLALLISHAGQMVSRDQIREALWPDHDYVGHEKTITNLASRLRVTLEDDPNAPRFIEATPKRGYKWIHPLELVQETAQIEDELAVEETAVDQTSDSDTEIEVPNDGLTPEPNAVAEASPIPKSAVLPWMIGVAAAVIISVFSVAHYTSRSRTEANQVRTVFVGIVPFETTSPEARDLADSFRLDLTDSISKLPQINVRAAHSLEFLNQNPTNFAKNASHLGLDALILGKLKLDGKICHLELEFVRGKDLSHLATFSFTGNTDELPQLRDKIQIQTFAELNPASIGTVDLEAKLAPGSTTNRDAYASFLRAWLDLTQQTPSSLLAALSGYQRAIAKDPNFGRAHAQLARTWIFLGDNGIVSRKESLNNALEEANKALKIDPNDAGAHDTRGLLYVLLDWNLLSGESELERAILLSPNEALHHQWLSLVYCDEGRFNDALREIDVAHAEDPDWSSAYITDAHISSMARDRPHAEAAIRRLMELVPRTPHALDAVANARWYLGEYKEAVATWRSMALIENDSSRVALEDEGAMALQTGGPRSYAKVRIRAIEHGQNNALHSNDFDAAEWYATAGDTDNALATIKRNVESHDLWMLELGFSPAYDGLRGDKRFRALVQAIRLETNGQSSSLLPASSERLSN